MEFGQDRIQHPVTQFLDSWIFGKTKDKNLQIEDKSLAIALQFDGTGLHSINECMSILEVPVCDAAHLSVGQ